MTDDKLLNKLKKTWVKLQEAIEPVPPIEDEIPTVDDDEVDDVGDDQGDEYHDDNVRATADFKHHENEPETTPETNPENTMSQPDDKSLKTCGSIFSGIGGWEYGAKQVGLKPIFAFEFHQKYADAYKKSHGDHVTVGDVKQTKSQLAHSSVDVLFSSPPCQNYSVAKNGQNAEEKPDAAKDVGFVTIEIARKTNAKVILMENVVAYMNSPVLKSIIEELGNDYHVHVNKVYANDYGCPTTRMRMIATFVRKDLFSGPFIPSPSSQTLTGKGKRNSLGGANWYDAIKDLIPELQPGGIAPWQRERLDRWGIADLNFPLQISGNNGSCTAFKKGKQVRVFRQANEPSFTIVKSWRAMQMTRILFKDGTCLRANPHCFARWQSFPDAIFENLPEDVATSTEMIGNAVPPQLCVSILQQLKNIS